MIVLDVFGAESLSTLGPHGVDSNTTSVVSLLDGVLALWPNHLEYGPTKPQSLVVGLAERNELNFV